MRQSPSYVRCGCCAGGMDRRGFMKAAAAAGLAAALPGIAHAQTVETDELRTLLLICNEPAVWKPASNFIRGLGQAVGPYEPIEIEGAAIGLVADQYNELRQEFWDKLMAAVAFQQTRRVIALNHRGCAAMKTAYRLGKTKDGVLETETHRYALQEFRSQMAERNPGVYVEIGLIGRDGKVEIFK